MTKIRRAKERSTANDWRDNASSARVDAGESSTQHKPLSLGFQLTEVQHASLRLLLSSHPELAVASTLRVRRQQRSNNNAAAKGPWSDLEQQQFLHGLLKFGWGLWKEIGTVLTTRYVAIRRIRTLIQRHNSRIPTNLLANGTLEIIDKSVATDKNSPRDGMREKISSSHFCRKMRSITSMPQEIWQ